MPHLPYFLMVYTAFMHRFVIYICQMSWQKNKIKLPAPPNITNRQKQDRKNDSLLHLTIFTYYNPV